MLIGESSNWIRKLPDDSPCLASRKGFVITGCSFWSDLRLTANASGHNRYVTHSTYHRLLHYGGSGTLLANL